MTVEAATRTRCQGEYEILARNSPLRTRSRRYFVSKGIFVESQNNELPGISRLTVKHTLLYDNVALFDRNIN